MFKSLLFYCTATIIFVTLISKAIKYGQQNPFKYLIPFDASTIVLLVLIFLIVSIYVSIFSTAAYCIKKKEHSLVDFWFLFSLFK